MSMMKQGEEKRVAFLLQRIREQKPLIHHITNMVVMNDTANVTLAIGALPVMAHAPEEVEEMVDLASALVLNIGTLDGTRVESMLRAGKRANQRGIPIVLDPVGAGATRLRTRTALRLLHELRVAVVRGNAAELAALIGIAGETRGVASMSIAGEREMSARRAAGEFGCAVAITGARDLIMDGERLAYVDNGHPLLAAITGSGCMATSLIAAFLAVEPDRWFASIAGLICIGLAGELAAQRARGPGTFHSHVLDMVAALDEPVLARGQKVSLV